MYVVKALSCIAGNHVYAAGEHLSDNVSEEEIEDLLRRDLIQKTGKATEPEQEKVTEEKTTSTKKK